MRVVLGIHGNSKAGKDTAADYLIDSCGWDAKFSFAHNLKDMCKRIFVLSDYEVNTQEGKTTAFSSPIKFTTDNLGSVLFLMSMTHAHSKIDPESKAKVATLVGTELLSPRHVLQFIGVDVCRLLVPSYHVDVLVSKILESKVNKVIVTDVRFPNEGDAVLDTLKGLMVSINRPVSAMVGPRGEHISETAMDSWGRFNDVIDNDTEGLSFFYSKINEFLERNEL